MSTNGWIGVDLDGTLAEYDSWKGSAYIGRPIWPMVKRVRAWLAEGKEVRIFTARAFDPEESKIAIPAIKAWCLYFIGAELPVTCIKDYAMVVLYDDRCRQVHTNTGKLVEDEVIEWHECAKHDPTMEGPRFKGWDRSALERCRQKYIKDSK